MEITDGIRHHHNNMLDRKVFDLQAGYHWLRAIWKSHWNYNSANPLLRRGYCSALIIHAGCYVLQYRTVLSTGMSKCQITWIREIDDDTEHTIR